MDRSLTFACLVLALTVVATACIGDECEATLEPVCHDGMVAECSRGRTEAFTPPLRWETHDCGAGLSCTERVGGAVCFTPSARRCMDGAREVPNGDLVAYRHEGGATHVAVAERNGSRVRVDDGVETVLPYTIDAMRLVARGSSVPAVALVASDHSVHLLESSEDTEVFGDASALGTFDGDGDGLEDLILETSTGIAVWPASSTRRAGAIEEHPTPGRALHSGDDAGADTIALGDVDGDGAPEIAFHRYGATTLHRVSADGLSFVAEVPDAGDGWFPVAAAFADLDGDGRAELALVQQDMEQGQGRSLVVYRFEQGALRVVGSRDGLQVASIGPSGRRALLATVFKSPVIFRFDTLDLRASTFADDAKATPPSLFVDGDTTSTREGDHVFVPTACP